MMNWIKFAFFIAAILILHEAFTETVGILLVGNGADWIAIKNVALLLMDLVLGFGILFSIFLSNGDFPKGVSLGIIMCALVLHAGRTIEYIFTPEIAYCYYPAMFWMNNLKLVALLIALGLTFLSNSVKIDLNNLKNIPSNGF